MATVEIVYPLKFSKETVQETSFSSFIWKETLSPPKQMLPMQIVRRSVPNCQDLRSRLLIKGHKYFSKFVASGEETAVTLQKIQRSRNLKLIHSFEFDPYFCETSCIKPLKGTLKRLKATKEVNLMIRRAEFTNETNTIDPYLQRIHRLKKFKLEFSKILNFDDKGFMGTLKAVNKCYSLKCLEYKFLDLIGSNANCNACFAETQKRLPQLEEYKILVALKKGTAREDFRKKENVRKSKSSKLKVLHLAVSVSSEWSFMGEEEDHQSERFAKNVSGCVNLQELSLKMIQHPIQGEMAMHTMNSLAKLPHFRNFSLELLNCPFGDLEAMAFAMGISKLPNLEKLTFKVLQNPNLSSGCIHQIVSLLLRCKTLEKFDLYFRRVDFSRETMIDLIGKIRRMNNINCAYFNQSLHIFKSNKISFHICPN